MRKCANISPYLRRQLVIYDFATAAFLISLYMRKILFSFLSVYNTNGGEGGRCNCSHPFPTTQLASVQIFNKDIVEEQICSNLFNRVVSSFIVMAPIRQKIRELCEEKSSNLESQKCASYL
jgi:hypothetical protein